MAYKINIPLVGGDGTRPFEFIDSAGNMILDEIQTKFDIGTANLQGLTSGYKSGGTISAQTSPYSTPKNVIDKFPFASDDNATDVGDLTQARSGLAGQSSTTNGYSSGGFPGSGVSPYVTDTIDKFPFSVDANATDVGNLTIARQHTSGQSSAESGYTSGGSSPTNPGGFPPMDTIDKFPFAADANATNVGDLTVARGLVTGQSSTAHGYVSGGSAAPPPITPTNVIDKFPFASGIQNATDVGDLTIARTLIAGQSSTTHGYVSGGGLPSNNATDVIDKFPFSSDANAADVGNLSQGRRGPSGTSSTTNGYSSGGYIINPSVVNSDVIDKFSFSADGNATDVGNLTQGMQLSAGQQV